MALPRKAIGLSSDLLKQTKHKIDKNFQLLNTRSLITSTLNTDYFFIQHYITDSITDVKALYTHS